MRLTLADCRPTIARVLNVVSTDASVVDYLNEATQRLLNKGKWVGSYMRYRICVNNRCITWPRQIETIETVSISGNPAPVNNAWFEFYPNGPGSVTTTCSSGDCSSYGKIGLFDRMNACAFDDIVWSGNAKKIRVVSDLNETAGTTILLQGYDKNGQWIRSVVGGSYIDGEYVAVGTGGADSANNFSALTGVQKTVTNGNVRLYELDTVTADLRALAVYEPDETRPDYRRSLLTGLPSCDEDDCKTSVEVMAKLKFIPVVNDTDWVMLGNLPALKLEVMAIKKEERNLMEEAIVYSAKAVELLREELKQWMGDGARLILKVTGDSTWAANGIQQVI